MLADCKSSTVKQTAHPAAHACWKPAQLRQAAPPIGKQFHLARIEADEFALPLNDVHSAEHIFSRHVPVRMGQCIALDEQSALPDLDDTVNHQAVIRQSAKDHVPAADWIRTDGLHFNQVAILYERMHARATGSKAQVLALPQDGRGQGFKFIKL